MNEAIQEYLSNAGFAFVNGQYEVVLELCKKAIAEDPSNADAYTGAGKACLVLEKMYEAEDFFQKAVDLDSTNGERYFDLGNIKFGLEQFPAALMNYAKAEQLGCNDVVRPKLYYQIGIINHISGDTKAALINFDKADAVGVINEDTKEILLKRLQIHLELEDFASAENYAIQLKMLAPTEFRSYQIYFQVLVAFGKYEQAEEQLLEAEKYSDIDSDIFNKVDMCFNRAMIFAVKAELEPENMVGHYQSAIAIFDDFLTTPDLPQDVIINIVMSKADIFMKMESYDDALHCIENITTSDNYDETDVVIDEPINTDGAENQEISAEEETREKVDFVKLTCYLGKEDYEEAILFAESLKISNNEGYKYFATYADAFITKKFADKDESKREVAMDAYNNSIAFFKHKAFENPMDYFANIYRIRLYAENGKFAMAEDLIKILPDELKDELNKYISDYRAEFEKE